MLAVLPEYEMFPTNTGCANLTPNGLVCTVRPEPVLKLVGGFGVTFATFHPLMFWLNALALLNMKFMSVTAPVSHESIGALNDVLDWNRVDMSVMRVVTMLLNGTTGNWGVGLNGPSVPLA
jgi:hypothetical protein